MYCFGAHATNVYSALTLLHDLRYIKQIIRGYLFTFPGGHYSSCLPGLLLAQQKIGLKVWALKVDNDGDVFIDGGILFQSVVVLQLKNLPTCAVRARLMTIFVSPSLVLLESIIIFSLLTSVSSKLCNNLYAIIKSRYSPFWQLRTQ